MRLKRDRHQISRSENNKTFPEGNKFEKEREKRLKLRREQALQKVQINAFMWKAVTLWNGLSKVVMETVIMKLLWKELDRQWEGKYSVMQTENPSLCCTETGRRSVVLHLLSRSSAGFLPSVLKSYSWHNTSHMGHCLLMRGHAWLGHLPTVYAVSINMGKQGSMLLPLTTAVKWTEQHVVQSFLQCQVCAPHCSVLCLVLSKKRTCPNEVDELT